MVSIRLAWSHAIVLVPTGLPGAAALDTYPVKLGELLSYRLHRFNFGGRAENWLNLRTYLLPSPS
jgi:hypothetical protein